VAVEAAQAGAKVLRGLFGSSHLEPELKAKNDYVTRADRESEAVVLEVIRAHHPEHRVLAEESGRTDLTVVELWNPEDGPFDLAAIVERLEREVE
jgi:fructose-1,6-bisphosphatase/inositol monophosphatase family enzyme